MARRLINWLAAHSLLAVNALYALSKMQLYSLSLAIHSKMGVGVEAVAKLYFQAAKTVNQNDDNKTCIQGEVLRKALVASVSFPAVFS
jgi:hypothetical protein